MYSELDFFDDYQPDAIQRLTSNPTYGLLVDMGLGKTVIVLTAFNDRKRRGGRAMLVIGPLRVCETVWEQEAREWSHLRHLKFVRILGSAGARRRALYEKGDVYLMNVDNVPWLAGELYAMQQAGRELPFDWLVVDESSGYKNTASKRFRAIRAILPAFPRRNILTGTPTPNSLLELWPQVFILDQGQRLETTFEQYKNRYFERDDDTGMLEPKQGAERRIYAKISDVCLRLDSEGMEGIPQVITPPPLKFTLPPRAQRVYDEMEERMFVQLDQIYEDMQRRGYVVAVNSAVLIGKCHQVVNGAIFESEARTIWHPIHDARLGILEAALDEINSPVIITYSYRHDRERLLKLLGDKTPVIGGGNKDTEGIVERWNNGEYRHLIAHPKSMGHGLNLQKGPGHHIAFFSNTWSLELHDQAIARLKRRRQAASHVTAIKICATGTVDEAMLERVRVRAVNQRRGLAILREYQLRKEAR